MRTKIGTVVSNKMDKTVVVSVKEDRLHPKYGKKYSRSTKFHAHTEKEIAEGTKVKIGETRPISKTKCWNVVEVY